METPKEPQKEKQPEEEIPLDKNDPDSIYNWDITSNIICVKL